MSFETPAEILEHEASAAAVRGFIAWRKLTKKPLTERAAVRVATTLRDITGAGGDADEALDLAQEHGWQTIKADWYWRIKNGNGNQRTIGTIANGRSDRPDPALEQIARLAGIGRASGHGGD